MLDRARQADVVRRPRENPVEDEGHGLDNRPSSDWVIGQGLIIHPSWNRAPDDSQEVLRSALVGELLGDVWDDIGPVNPVAACQEIALPPRSDLIAGDPLVFLDQSIEQSVRRRTESEYRCIADPRASLSGRPAPSTSTLF